MCSDPALKTESCWQTDSGLKITLHSLRSIIFKNNKQKQKHLTQTNLQSFLQKCILCCVFTGHVSVKIQIENTLECTMQLLCKPYTLKFSRGRASDFPASVHMPTSGLGHCTNIQTFCLALVVTANASCCHGITSSSNS